MAVLGRSAARVGLLTDRRRPAPDVVMFVIMAAMLALGVLMVYSATRVRLETVGEDPTAAMQKQLIFAAGALVAFVFTSLINYHEYRNLLPFLYVGTLGLLVYVLFTEPIANAQRWIQLPFDFQLQPSEVAKLVIILTLAMILAPAPEEGMRWQRLTAALAVVAIPSYLIFRQPDLGTMLVFGFMTLVVLFAAGTTFRQLLALIGAGLVGIVAFWQLELLKSYQVARVTSFLDQSQGLRDLNYNLNQSQIAIGSGQLFGRGLFQGTQTELSYVPAQTTDFIFTAIGEQLGFVGAAIVVVAYALLLWRILRIAIGASDRFGSLIAVGVAGMLMFHVFINIGMTIGVAPVTGLPLPFISAGGTAMIVMAASLGVVNSVWRDRSPVPGREYVPL